MYVLYQTPEYVRLLTENRVKDRPALHEKEPKRDLAIMIRLSKMQSCVNWSSDTTANDGNLYITVGSQTMMALACKSTQNHTMGARKFWAGLFFQCGTFCFGIVCLRYQWFVRQQPLGMGHSNVWSYKYALICKKLSESSCFFNCIDPFG
jgi:hypothetical protein